MSNDATERPTSSTDEEGDTPGDSLSSLHQRLVAASGIEVEAAAARVDGQWTKTLFISGYPDTAMTGMLDRALTLPDIEFDYSIHVMPLDSSSTISALEKNIQQLEVKRTRQSESGDITEIETTKQLEEHTAIYEQLLDGSQQVLDVSLYLTVRGPDRETVERAAERIRSNLGSVQLRPATAMYRQTDALVSTSPIGRDVLGQSATMLGGAVGCLFPFAMGTHIEDSGVLFGYHAVTGSPVVVDRFARETGYNCVVMGNTGAGKTFGTLVTLLRRLGKDPNTLVFVADPFGDLGALTEILGGERVTVSGSQGFNPLAITPTPESVLTANPDLDPYKKTVQKDALGFIEAFFDMEGMSLEGKRGLLSIALRQAYRRQGITPDPATHDNPSPTLRDVRDVVQDIADDPASYTGSAPASLADVELELWQRRASQLAMDLAPFRAGGEYEHLGRPTDVDLRGADVTYLDMQQIEGEQKTGVMLQLLLHAVYDRAKQTDKRVIFAIDEAHYLLRTGASLEFLERAVRHARHYDLSLQFITQTADEFFTDETAQAAKVIADNCALKLFYNIQGLSDEDAAEWLDLSAPEAEFVRSARPGSEEYGYSQALVEIGDVGRFPINVRALPQETALITDSGSRPSTSSTQPTAGAAERASGESSTFSNGAGEATGGGSSRTDVPSEARLERTFELLQERATGQLFNKIHSVESSGESTGHRASPADSAAHGGDPDGG